MIEGWYPATVAGVALGLAVLVPRVIPPLRRALPELVVVAVLLAAWRGGVAPWDKPALWVVSLTSLPLAAWLVLLGVPLLLAERDLGDPTPANAVLGGLLVGPLATAAVLAPRASDPGSAGRLAVLAGAAGILSPFGPALLLIVGADGGWIAWASPVALAGVLLAWPRQGDPWGVAPRPGVMWPALIGGAVALGVGTAAGAAVLLAGLTLHRVRSGARQPVTAGGWYLARLVAATALAAPVVHLSGGAWFAAQGARWWVERGLDPMALPAMMGAAAVLLDPLLLWSALERVDYVSHRLPTDLLPAIALLVAVSPLAPLAVCRRPPTADGWRVPTGGWRPGLILVTVAVAWVLITT